MNHIKRAAFTLTELLVVILLLVVLAGLGIGAATKGYGWVKQRNTETTMTKVAQRLQRHMDRALKEADDWPSVSDNLIYEQASGSMERARVLKTLYLYKWSFPNTYAEAFHNVQESRILYDPAGYPPARAILARLTRHAPSIPDPFSGPPTSAWSLGTPAVAAMPTAVPAQSSACLLAAYIAANGSPDEFGANEIADVPGDYNQMLVDAWGTPLLFLRHGNFIHSRHVIGGSPRPDDRAAWSMGMVRPGGVAELDFAPLEYVLNPSTAQPPQPGNVTSFYFNQIQQRAISAHGLTGRDPFDPVRQLKNDDQWRLQPFVGTPPGWLPPAASPWLPATGPGNPPLHVTMFRRTFGYCPETDITSQGYQNQAFAPMVILSAGGDRLFATWDDNLDSYRLKLSVSGQQ